MAPVPTLAERAARESRDYITPEDIQDAIADGTPKFDLWEELLAILGKQRELGVEDPGLCCFLAWKYES